MAREELPLPKPLQHHGDPLPVGFHGKHALRSRSDVGIVASSKVEMGRPGGDGNRLKEVFSSGWNQKGIRTVHHLNGSKTKAFKMRSLNGVVLGIVSSLFYFSDH